MNNFKFYDDSNNKIKLNKIFRKNNDNNLLKFFLVKIKNYLNILTLILVITIKLNVKT